MDKANEVAKLVQQLQEEIKEERTQRLTDLNRDRERHLRKNSKRNAIDKVAPSILLVLAMFGSFVAGGASGMTIYRVTSYTGDAFWLILTLVFASLVVFFALAYRLIIPVDSEESINENNI